MTAMDEARAIADEIALAMKHYPMLLRSTPPILMDIDEAYSLRRGIRITHIPATRPDRRFD